MRDVRTQFAEVALEDDLAVVQDEQSVGIGPKQRVLQRETATVRIVEGEVDQRIRGLAQRPGGSVPRHTHAVGTSSRQWL